MPLANPRARYAAGYRSENAKPQHQQKEDRNTTSSSLDLLTDHLQPASFPLQSPRTPLRTQPLIQLRFGTISERRSARVLSSRDLGKTYFGSGRAVCTTSSIGLEFDLSLCVPLSPVLFPSKSELRTGRLANAAEFKGGVDAGDERGLFSRLGRETLRAGKLVWVGGVGKYDFGSDS